MTGFIVLYKPEGITSFSAVARVRRITGEKKIGHCGTLDPMAIGVLPIMLGGATRFLDFLPSKKKCYTAVMRLGLTTDTLDITGTVTAQNEVNVTKAVVEEALKSFRGEIFQVPPMYSAIKKDGVRMYDLARKGIEVEREARPVTIYNLELSDKLDGKQLSKNEYALYVECSSGTYIRTLIDDIGHAIGCGAVMTKLERTYAAGFTKAQALTLEQLEEIAQRNNDTLSGYLISVEDALSTYPELLVTSAQGKRFSNGGELSLDRVPTCKGPGLYRMAFEDNFVEKSAKTKHFLGLGEADFENNQITVKRVYVEK